MYAVKKASAYIYIHEMMKASQPAYTTKVLESQKNSASKMLTAKHLGKTNNQCTPSPLKEIDDLLRSS